LRLETLDVPPQDIITRDNVSVKVNAVCYFRVVDANLALSQVQNYQYATSQLAQTTLRSVVGQFELDEILSQREKVNAKLQVILDQDTEPWGIKVTKVEVKQVDIPEQMQRAIAKQAEAERERRAKIIHADGEYEASSKLADAAKVLETQRSAIQLRYLQTVTEIASENKSTTIFPLPIDLFKGLVESGAGRNETPALALPEKVSGEALLAPPGTGQSQGLGGAAGAQAGPRSRSAAFKQDLRGFDSTLPQDRRQQLGPTGLRGRSWLRSVSRATGLFRERGGRPSPPFFSRP
jgi:hypothetical protein